MKIRLNIFALLISVAVCVPAGASEATDLFERINDRLLMMEQVAAWKWLEDVPIEDTAREAVVLDRAAESGARAGLTPDSSRAFFRAQIDAAKEIQEFWFKRFERYADSKPDSAPDLTGEIRPRLLELGDRITAAIASAGVLDDSMMLRRDFVRTVTVPGLSSETRMALYDALIQVEFFASRLDQILATGELRIGTTGDYAPFSFRQDESGELTGIDIDLARNLAASLDAEPVFVQTAWPTLMQDLADNTFDIGMSGVSRTLARQRIASFSRPYHVGGKTPIARCEDKDAYDSLDEIDRDGVRVIVNPGGTNERFARGRLRRANVRVFDDNRKIFDEIVAGRADVMITDAIEVSLKAAQHAGLCATLPGETFTYQEKAYLLPRDETWKDYVDAWVSQRMGDGTVEATFEGHLE